MGLNGEVIASIQNYQQLSASLLLYRSIFLDDIGRSFLDLLIELPKKDPFYARGAYGRWFSALANEQKSWQQYLRDRILIADNAFSARVQTLPASAIDQLENHIEPHLLAAAENDLAILSRYYQLSAMQVSQWVGDACDSPAPPFIADSSTQSDWLTTASVANHYRAHGVGIFGQFTAFRWQKISYSTTLPAGELVGIPSPDPIELSQLVAYDHPKQQLIQNTEFLLRGYTAQNVLLYGSRGAGKSSLVKALLNEYSAEGLRLIEVPKAHLPHLPHIIGTISRVPQKFIIFIDDLSFEEDDEAFKALKVVLEGGMTARSQNVVVYATSNRRHLVREFFDDRPKPKDADEIQSWDTVQEKLSFSDRFGLTLTFTPADQSTYLTIVHQLAQQAGLTLEAENLDWRARQWATRHNGRSGRTARQFVDFLIAEQGD
ncbi:MAG: ATP-binding protein [Cyanobacteria bacterium J06576_12]